MSRRFQIVLSSLTAQRLASLAAVRDRPPSTLAAELVDRALQPAAETHETPPANNPASPSAAEPAFGRAAWLEPHGGDPTWRSETWRQILALHERYPHHLAHLKDGWWQDAAHLEMLCALAAWREQLDREGENPQEEIAFQTQLADYAQTLRAEGGGLSKAWKPGEAPADWLVGDARRDSLLRPS